MKILITGSTGNVGQTVLKKFQTNHKDIAITAAVREINRGRKKLGTSQDFVEFDLEMKIYPKVEFDAIFLVRPPQIADPALFETFLRGLHPDTKIVFLSVQGAESRAYLPHAKIERVIRSLGLPHCFLRPSYFMENLTTTLWGELSSNKRIFMPSADLAFNWIAIEDIAEIAAMALVGDVSQTEVTLTNLHWHTFGEIIDLINRQCGTELTYQSPSMLRYVAYNIRQGEPFSYTLVMLLLHFLPRFSRNRDPVSDDFVKLTGRPPIEIEAFIAAHCDRFNTI
ncbi:MAG: NmrA family NAD(P)-binding protein [Chloroflexota bacterium]